MQMTIFELKKYFIQSINRVYEINEAESIFFIVLEELFNISKTDYLINKNEEVGRKKKQMLDLIIADLQNHKPIQYIIGHHYFYGNKFFVNQHTLIPRQETEFLVHNIINRNNLKENLKILDIGTGTGCIAISLKLNLKNAEAFACDISEKALTTAHKNAKINNVDINFYKFDILENYKEIWHKSLDIIVSNPPYISESEKILMKKNVLEYEPHSALFVKNDRPLVFYEAISNFALLNLKSGGQLWFEINEFYGEKIVKMLEDKCFAGIELIKDLNGKNRIVTAFKPE